MLFWPSLRRARCYGCAAPADAVQIVTEPGTGATLSSSSSWWTVVQTRALANPVSGQWPCLTAGTNKAQAPLKGCGDATPDAVGSGVIRLVDYSGVTSYEEGLMVSPPITAADGLKLTFDADSVIKGYGANAASMVLVNGDVAVDTSTGQWYYGGSWTTPERTAPAPCRTTAFPTLLRVSSWTHGQGVGLEPPNRVHRCSGQPDERAVLRGPGRRRPGTATSPERRKHGHVVGQHAGGIDARG